MIYNARVKRRLPASFCLTALALLLIFALSFLRPFLFSLTGEEKLGGQLLGLWQLAGDVIRPRPVLDPDAPIAHTGVNPFGINTFLQQEVEPAKRERQVQMIAEAG
ncbi:MAG: hypothetical protein HY023_02630, partial [Chloroflexi bacterium]|nr:hypothetical protein [Chloroflexota bacterium]